jgi:predicted dinucleotide-binding enzyme
MVETMKLTRRVLLAAMAVGLALPQSVFAQTQSRSKPKIGFIGAGRIGGALAKLWTAAGYQVMLSGADIAPVQQLATQLGPNAQAGSPAQAAAFGDVVVVTVPYGALPQVGRDYAAQLKGKVVLDTCNPNPARDGDMTKDALAKGTGVMDPTYLPGTRLVRAFNTIGAGNLVPMSNHPGERIGVPLASDDKAALAIAAQMVRDAGYEPVIVGDLSTAKSFDTGTPGYGKALPASQIRANMNLKS